MSKIRNPNRSPIVGYLNENLVLHARLNAHWDLDKAEGLDAKFRKHFEHEYHTKTQDLLVHGAFVASLHDGYIETLTERRIPGTDRIRTVIRASAYFYDVASRMEVGRGEVVFTFEGKDRIRKQGNFQNNRIFESVLDMDSKRMGLTLCPDWHRNVVVEFAFETMDIAMRIIERYDDRAPDNLSFVEEQTGETA